jgi:hypothetical protein
MAKIVPRGNTPFYLFTMVFLANLKPIMVRINFDQAFYNDVLIVLFLQFEIAYKKCLDRVHRTQADIIDRNKFRAELEPNIHRAIELVRNLPGTTEQDLKDLLIYIKPHTSTPKPAPKKSPILEQLQSAEGTVTVRALDRETKRPSKPEGAKGWVLKYAFGDEPPKTKAGYTHQQFSSETSCTVKLPEEMIGKPMHARGYWTNTKGDPSPWSPVLTVIVPG